MTIFDICVRSAWILSNMDGDAIKSKFKTFIDKTKRNVGNSNASDTIGSQDIMGSDSIALAAAER